MFTDRVKFKVSAGKGGDGVIVWRREKYIPKGGPYGGNGGKGGSVIVRADTQFSSLEHHRYSRKVHAEDGGNGGPNRQQGASGEDLILKVPCGTLVKDRVTEEVLCDLVEPGQEFLLCKGGRGGRGNASFANSINRSPNYCTQGTLGEELDIEFELKLIADIGFVGFPNAGKSTLLEALTSTQVKTAPYPFTTLHPNLGFLKDLRDQENRAVLIADIPGIIEGAHQNKGLGIEFLRHIERTLLLLFVLDSSGDSGRSPEEDYQVLLSELTAYDPELLERQRIIVLNKNDGLNAPEYIEAFVKAHPKETIYAVSALEGDGIPELIAALRKLFPAEEKKEEQG